MIKELSHLITQQILEPEEELKIKIKLALRKSKFYFFKVKDRMKAIRILNGTKFHYIIHQKAH